MSYNSKQKIVSMVAGILLFSAYVLYALGANAPAPEDLKSWARVMLIFIGISVGAVSVIQIFFHIAVAVGVAVKERVRDEKTVGKMISSMVAEDERDKLINLKSSFIGYAVAGGGAIAGLVALVSGAMPVVALHIMFGAFGVGAIAEGAVSVFFYEKGIRQ